MTYSYTYSSTFTRTNAEYLASKVAADLKQIQCFYNLPSDYKIIQYIEEIVILLLSGCLKSIKYGFKRNGFWVVFVEYKAQFGNIRPNDDNPGRIYPGANIENAEWTSFLDVSHAHLSVQEKIQITQALPFQRSEGVEPRLGSGNLRSDRYYSSGDGALQRKVYY